jgi:hypothetical protein
MENVDENMARRKRAHCGCGAMLVLFVVGKNGLAIAGPN